jgi:U3 small nucleolar RNA-associated protein 6
VELWTEYVKMEMMFVETLRRRWKVLGLEQEEPVQIEGSEDDHAEDLPGMNMNAGAEARKEVLRGAIVKSAIGSAVQG